MRASTPHQRAYWPHDTQVFWPLRTKWSLVLDGSRAQRGEVGAGVGLGEALAPDLLGGQDRRDVPPALLVRAEAQQRRAEDVEPDDVDELRGARRRELLVDDDLLDGRPAAATESLWPRTSDVPGFVAGGLPVAEDLHPFVERAREVGRRQAALRQEGADLRLKRAFLVGGAKLH